MIRGMTALWTALAVIIGIGLFLLKYEVSELHSELAGINQEIYDNKEAIHVLKAEWSYLNDPDRLRDLNDRHLGLVPIPPARIASLDTLPTADEPATGLAEAPAPVKPAAARPAVAVPTAPRPSAPRPPVVAAATKEKPLAPPPAQRATTAARLPTPEPASPPAALTPAALTPAVLPVPAKANGQSNVIVITSPALLNGNPGGRAAQ
ncbi:MAG: energy transducer TonB [Rhodospirillales bacterium]|nr:energy transducer TonB [Rhodospirillales bacterium]